MNEEAKRGQEKLRARKIKKTNAPKQVEEREKSEVKEKGVIREEI